MRQAMSDVTSRPCGTMAAYARHKYRGEEVDDACRAAMSAYMRERRAIQRAKRPLRQCRECAELFAPPRSDSTFCGVKCAQKSRSRVAWHAAHGELAPRLCEWCDREWTPRHRDARICSTDCRSQARKVFNHGLTIAVYRSMLKEQGFLCAGCEEPLGAGSRQRQIDHDHTCCPGEYGCAACVRGVVCPRCNRMLRDAKDSLSVLTGCASYLIRSFAVDQFEPRFARIMATRKG